MKTLLLFLITLLPIYGGDKEIVKFIADEITQDLKNKDSFYTSSILEAIVFSDIRYGESAKQAIKHLKDLASKDYGGAYAIVRLHTIARTKQLPLGSQLDAVNAIYRSNHPLRYEILRQLSDCENCSESVQLEAEYFANKIPKNAK